MTRSHSDRRYNSLSPNTNFSPMMLQQEFARVQPNIEEETDDQVSHRELDHDDDRVRKV